MDERRNQLDQLGVAGHRGISEAVIEAYDKKTGDGNWLRQSLQILQEEIESVQRIESQMAEENRRANAGINLAATSQKDLQGCSAG